MDIFIDTLTSLISIPKLIVIALYIACRNCARASQPMMKRRRCQIPILAINKFYSVTLLKLNTSQIGRNGFKLHMVNKERIFGEEILYGF